MAPKLTLHALPPSHPCMTVAAALQLKGLEFDRVDLAGRAARRADAGDLRRGELDGPGPDGGRRAGPRLAGRSWPASRRSSRSPSSTPPMRSARPSAGAMRSSRISAAGCPGARFTSGPSCLPRSSAAAQLDGPGTDYAIRMIRAGWKYHSITAARLHDDLAGLPAKLDHIEQLARLGRDRRRAAQRRRPADRRDRQRSCCPWPTSRPLLSGSAAERLARSNFAELAGTIPAGTYPAGWVPSR